MLEVPKNNSVVAMETAEDAFLILTCCKNLEEAQKQPVLCGWCQRFETDECLHQTGVCAGFAFNPGKTEGEVIAFLKT